MDTIVGHHLYDPAGEDVGEIVDVVGVAGPDLAPSWVTVKTGWFNQRLVPFDKVETRGDEFATTCSADTIKQAPKVPVHFEPAGDDLDQLCRHYGMPVASY
jgi:hypothetical protein